MYTNQSGLVCKRLDRLGSTGVLDKRLDRLGSTGVFDTSSFGVSVSNESSRCVVSEPFGVVWMSGIGNFSFV